MAFPVQIKFVKTHEDAKLPSYNHSDPYTGDSGLDVATIDGGVVPARGSCIVPVGLKLGYITPGYWLRVEGKSGRGFKFGLAPHQGIIDNPFRGDLGIKIYNLTDNDFSFKKGDNIAQFVVYQLIQADTSWIDTATDTPRGEKGFGSSDK